IEIQVNYESVEILKQLDFKYSTELVNGEKIIKKVIFKEVSLDDTEKEEERTLWLSMLPALTTIDEVKGALLHYGELEMVKLWPSITGLTGNAKIIFKNSDGIQKFKEKD